MTENERHFQFGHPVEYVQTAVCGSGEMGGEQPVEVATEDLADVGLGPAAGEEFAGGIVVPEPC
ncbi:hypothetical protein [Streptosporangium sp. 'caverna']|uniref:hypothetical protein n=1 Tax=Streptosporangium sp. 'caverna' TaxID=2202249 RepID=UPI000D7E79E0|nr:hypothetical protein [Streptosporangium sp. 'caverna']AWS43711.1 hypothetical protein DKM19_22495 [Streptosporangium sp. 'caverna']